MRNFGDYPGNGIGPFEFRVYYAKPPKTYESENNRTFYIL